MDERLRALVGKEKTYKREDGFEITLKPLKGKELGFFDKMSKDPGIKDVIKMIGATLRNSGYEVTDEDVEELGADALTWLADCCVDVNGFLLDKKKQ